MSEIKRKAIVEIVARWAHGERRRLFVGNGYLLRDVAHYCDHPSNFYLLGGMGLASAVAVGYVAARPQAGAAIVEGDGNLLMGLPGAALCGGSGLDIVHVVHANGLYESSGGQPVGQAMSRSQALKMARGLGYRRASVVTTKQGLRTALQHCGGASNPAFIWISGGPDDARTARTELAPRQIAERFRAWSATERE